MSVQLSQALLFMIFSFHLTAGASESLGSENLIHLKSELNQGNIHNPKGLWPLLGIGLGHMNSSQQLRTGGIPMHFKLLGSYYFQEVPVITDVGVGLHNQILTQNGEGSSTISTFYSELAARYQFSERWQLGVIWNTLVDTADRYQANTSKLPSFIGVQVLKEFVWDDDYLVRAGGRAMTDVGLKGQPVQTIMAELEVSFGSPKSHVATSFPVTPIAPHLQEQAIKSYGKAVITPHFNNEAVQLLPSSQAYLQRLAHVLAENKHLFEKVEIHGKSNIGHQLLSQGLYKNKISAKSAGAQELTGLTTTAKNQQFEMKFIGVKNQTALKNVIESVTF